MKQKKRTLRVITLTLLCATMLSGISLQAAITINKTTGSTIPGSIYYSPGDTIKIVNDPLEADDWYVLKGLTTVYHLELPDHNQPIPASALEENTAIRSIYAPEATSIEFWAFSDCTALTTVTFPKATLIRDYAFYNCAALTTAMFPEATFIGGRTFHGCTALTEITFSKVTSMRPYAFYNCSALTTVKFPEATSISGGGI